MIGAGQIERLKIERVARQLERDDLPPAVAGHFMPIGETRKEDGANVAPLDFTNDDAARVEAEQHQGKRRDRILVVGRKQAVAQKLSEQGSEAAGSKSGGHSKNQDRNPDNGTAS